MISPVPVATHTMRSAIPIASHGEGAFELKFVLDEAVVPAVMEWAQAHLPADPFGAEGGGFYEVHSLYFDTDGLDVYHGSGGFRDNKYRVRRYGREPLVYLERKYKVEGRVRKQRTPVPEEELALLTRPEAAGTWAGDWFRQRIRSHGLVPRCQVAYHRMARVGETEGAPIRLTLDRSIRSVPAAGLKLDRPETLQGLTHQRTVLELKYRHGFPALFTELVREFALEATSASKYRQAMSLHRLGDLARA